MSNVSNKLFLAVRVIAEPNRCVCVDGGRASSTQSTKINVKLFFSSSEFLLRLSFTLCVCVCLFVNSIIAFVFNLSSMKLNHFTTVWFRFSLSFDISSAIIIQFPYFCWCFFLRFRSSSPFSSLVQRLWIFIFKKSIHGHSGSFRSCPFNFGFTHRHNFSPFRRLSTVNYVIASVPGTGHVISLSLSGLWLLFFSYFISFHVFCYELSSVPVFIFFLRFISESIAFRCSHANTRHKYWSCLNRVRTCACAALWNKRDVVVTACRLQQIENKGHTLTSTQQ